MHKKILTGILLLLSFNIQADDKSTFEVCLRGSRGMGAEVIQGPVRDKLVAQVGSEVCTPRRETLGGRVSVRISPRVWHQGFSVPFHANFPKKHLKIVVHARYAPEVICGTWGDGVNGTVIYDDPEFQPHRFAGCAVE